MVLAVDIVGDSEAPTVILLHGGGQTRHSWRHAVDRLVAAGFRVINYDARGHGDSDWAADGDYSLAALGSDLAVVLELAGPRVALVGASMGGMTAFHATAIQQPAALRALVMVDIVLRPSQTGVERVRRFMNGHGDGFATLEAAADAVAAYNPERPRPSNPSGLMKNLRRREDGRFYWHWDPRFLSTRPSSEPPQFADTLTGLASRVRVPTLLVRGGKSDIIDDAGVADMKRLVPQTQIYDVADAGHMVVGDNNDPFVVGVVDFLRQHMF